MTRPPAIGLVRFLVPLAVFVGVGVSDARIATARARARAAKPAPKTVSTNVSTTNVSTHVSTSVSAKSESKTDGKVVVLFPIKYDDDRTLAVQIERILRTKGFEVVTGLRPVDTAEQYRDVATSMNLVAFVGGDYREVGEKASVTINVRSGYTGKKVIATTFKETPLHMHNEIEEKLWPKIGRVLARASVEANRPRKRARNALVIEAGTPLN
jgi:hypothetical protein